MNSLVSVPLRIHYNRVMGGPIVATAVFFGVLWFAEIFAPFYAEFGGKLGRKLKHDGKNLFIAAINTALTVFVFTGALVYAMDLGGEKSFGVLRWLGVSGWLGFVLAIVLFDFWMYLWHRANHAIPFLWRFHRMHHSERQMDVTTGVRFHPGEILLSAVARLAVVPLLGLELVQLATYEALLFPVVLFHHSNVSLPRWLDRGLLAVVVTPIMHRVHHSRWQPETDSNYGSVFPYWDVLFRSFRLRSDPTTIEIGLDEFDGNEWHSVGGMLKTPLQSSTRPRETEQEPTQ